MGFSSISAYLTLSILDYNCDMSSKNLKKFETEIWLEFICTCFDLRASVILSAIFAHVCAICDQEKFARGA